MRSYKERQFRKALSSPKLGFWPHCKNSDYNLLDDRQVCWVVQVRTGPELPGKQEQSSVVGRQLCTSMGRQAWRKGQLLVAWLLAVACGLKSRWLCLGDWRKQHFKCSRARLMGRASGGVAGVLVVSNRPHTGSGHCAQTWSTRWLLDYTLECAVGAEWHWACTHTHTHTHTVKDCAAWAEGSTPKSRRRGPCQSTEQCPLSTKLGIMLVIEEKCLGPRSLCGAGRREWMWSWEVESKLRPVLGSSLAIQLPSTPSQACFSLS